MSSYKTTRADIVEFQPHIKYDLPLAICDRSFAYHLGIHNKTLWFCILGNHKLYNVFSIKKRGRKGGRREIQDPEKRLKAVQSVFLVRFLNHIPLGPHVGAYVRGRSCLYTARQHVKSSVVISVDIKDFFPSVRRAVIRDYFRHCGYNNRVAGLMATLVTYRNFVPQGAPTSGMVANLIADWKFDQHIIQDLRQLDVGWRYTRYSDDIDISHPEEQSRESVLEAVNIVRSRVSAAGFRINERKTHITPRWRRQKVLGVVVNDKLSIMRFEYKRVEAIIHNSLMHGFTTQHQQAQTRSAAELVAHLRGKISYFKTIDEHKANRLKEKFDAALEIHAEELKDEVDFGTTGV